MKRTGMGKRVLFRCFLTAMAIFIGLSGAAWADDHISLNAPGCTKCHGDGIREIHDDSGTVPVDCNLCHATGGPGWYLNEQVFSMFGVTYDENPLTLITWETFYDEDDNVIDAYEYADDFVFDFDCQRCHFQVIHKER